MLTRQISKARIRLGVYRSLVIPVVFVLSLLIFFVSPVVAYCSLLLIPIILHWGMGGLEKKAERDEIIEKKIIPKNVTIVSGQVNDS